MDSLSVLQRGNKTRPSVDFEFAKIILWSFFANELKRVSAPCTMMVFVRHRLTAIAVSRFRSSWLKNNLCVLFLKLILIVQFLRGRGPLAAGRQRAVFFQEVGVTYYCFYDTLAGVPGFARCILNTRCEAPARCKAPAHCKAPACCKAPVQAHCNIQTWANHTQFGLHGFLWPPDPGGWVMSEHRK